MLSYLLSSYNEEQGRTQALAQMRNQEGLGVIGVITVNTCRPQFVHSYEFQSKSSMTRNSMVFKDQMLPAVFQK